MGGFLTSDLKAELYKWSSPEFPQEYAVVYTSRQSDSAGPSVFRVSVNRERVLCRVADYLDKTSPVRLHTLFTAERDGNGYRRLGEVRLVSHGTDKDIRQPQNSLCECSFGRNELNDTRPYGYYTVQPNQFTWEVRHSYYIFGSLRTILECRVKIQCDELNGLSLFDFCGPSKYKNLLYKEECLGSQIQREVNGEPPKAIKALVETEFKGESYTLFPQWKWNTTVIASVQATGVINNMGVNQGNYNGAVFTNCQFIAPH